MWMTWHQYRNADSALASSTLDLMQATLTKLIYVTAGLLLIWFFIAGAQNTDLLVWRFWVVLGLLAGSVAWSTHLVHSHAFLANLVWLSGLFLVILLMILLFGLPAAAFLFPIFPLLAVNTVGWPAGVLAICAVIGATELLGLSSYAGFLAPYRSALMIGSLITGFVGWIVANALMSEVQNTTYYYRQAREHMDEARTHRAKVLHILKDLDRAYYSLERANAAQVAAMRKAEDAERFKAEFVTYVSHEMRTPLNLILGYSETILTSPESYGGIPLTGVYREDLSKINRNAHHMLALISDVIDLSRADVNRIPLMRESVNVHPLVMDTMNMVSDYIRSKGLTLSVDIQPELKSVHIDALRIRQVLLNLLVNAARFTEAGGIRLQVEQHKTHILFRIIDSGQGIMPEELPHIFEEYHAGGQHISSWTGSSGLGLPISRALVELHGGQIGVKSEYGKGTEFWFDLPVSDEESVDSPNNNFIFTPVETHLPTPVIVAVCTDSQVSDTLQRLMNDYRIVPARDADEAAVLAQEHQAVAVIVPEGSRLAGCPSCAVQIECTLPGLHQVARDLGVMAVLEKPVQPANLLETVRKMVPFPENVLIVDDDVDVVELFERILAPHLGDGQCWKAYGGVEALQILSRGNIDLVLLDLAMPDIGGKQVLSHIQNESDYGNPAVIVISGTVQDTASMRIRDALRLSRDDGLTLGEAARALQAAVTELNPGWLRSRQRGESTQ